jgi:processive 1,2-diacylglycerol beta-glucosyltransferase
MSENSAKNKKIVFFSANAGTGHDQAAKAIADILLMKDKSISYRIVNSYEFINQPYRMIMEEGYIPFIKFFPQLYRYFYERKDKKASILGLKSWLNRSTSENFKKYLDKEQPDLIICTHAYPCGVLSEMKRKGDISARIIGVVTDFVVNPFWIYPETDLYLIAAEELKKTFVDRGVQEDRIKTTGIPINPLFNGRGPDREEARKKLNIDPGKPFVLFMGGGLGMKPACNSLDILRDVDIPLQAVVIMGKNEKGKMKIEKNADIFDKPGINVKAVGYVNNIYEYMKSADLLITKPGGMTTSEATATGLPMIITAPLPGQENQNVKYLTERGLAILAENEKEIPSLIQKTLKDPKILEDMSSKAERFSVPDSADKAADIVFSFLNS